MSTATREWVAYHDNMFYGTGAGVTKEQMINDLLKTPSSPHAEGEGVQTTMIALLEWLLKKDHIIEATCFQTGHGTSKAHTPGNGMDWWPLKSANQDDWMSAYDQRFYQVLYDTTRSQYCEQQGLNGDGSDSPECFHYAIKGFAERDYFYPGYSVFQDSGGPHLHTRSTYS